MKKVTEPKFETFEKRNSELNFKKKSQTIKNNFFYQRKSFPFSTLFNGNIFDECYIRSDGFWITEIQLTVNKVTKSTQSCMERQSAQNKKKKN